MGSHLTSQAASRGLTCATLTLRTHAKRATSNLNLTPEPLLSPFPSLTTIHCALSSSPAAPSLSSPPSLRRRLRRPRRFHLPPSSTCRGLPSVVVVHVVEGPPPVSCLPHSPPPTAVARLPLVHHVFFRRRQLTMLVPLSITHSTLRTLSFSTSLARSFDQRLTAP